MSSAGMCLLTDKQHEIMGHVLEAAGKGSYITLVELWRDKLSYGPSVSKQAVLCSVKFLAKHGFVIRQPDGRNSMKIIPTSKGYETFQPTPVTDPSAGNLEISDN